MNVEQRKGSETLTQLSEDCTGFGDPVFSENSKELKVSKGKLSDEAMRCITSKSTNYDSFIQRIERISIE